VRDRWEKKGIGGAESAPVKDSAAKPLAKIFPKNARPAVILVLLYSLRNIQISFLAKNPRSAGRKSEIFFQFYSSAATGSVREIGNELRCVF
jgi:hypothetical protein